MTPGDFRLLDRLRVRWAEIDAQQIVFNAHYLMYFDTAIAAYWRALAMPYAPTLEVLGGDLFVRKATVDYVGPARYDDVLDVGVRCDRFGSSSMTFTTAVFRHGVLLVSGELIYVFADPATQRARPVPSLLRDAIGAFESGAPMVEVRLGCWSELGADARAIRGEVFVAEQKIPAELESDAADDTALHAVARNRFGRALATGRLIERGDGVSQLGRLAVTASMRGTGIGAQVLEALLAAARSRGDREVMLHSQASAVSFYQRAGFESRGPGFTEAGILHVEMVRAP